MKGPWRYRQTGESGLNVSKASPFKIEKKGGGGRMPRLSTERQSTRLNVNHHHQPLVECSQESPRSFQFKSLTTAHSVFPPTRHARGRQTSVEPVKKDRQLRGEGESLPSRTKGDRQVLAHALGKQTSGTFRPAPDARTRCLRREPICASVQSASF